MTTQAILRTLELLYATHELPVACFQENLSLLHAYCSYPGYAPIFSAIAGKAPNDKTISLVSGYAGLYGTVHIRENKLLLVTGPFLNKKPDEALLDRLLHDYGLAWEEREPLKQFFFTLPRHPLNRFLNFVALLNYLFNGEDVSIAEYFKDALPRLQNKIGEKHSKEILMETDFSHGTYSFEQQLLSYVSAGDVAGIYAFFDAVSRSAPMKEGKVADDTLRQSKNIFIGLICMVGKVGAIRGNLDIEQTYRLIDLYTQECERCTSVSAVDQLRYTAIMDFTQRVAEQKHPEAYSSDVYQALQFIKTHTNQPIGVADVLEHVGRSRSQFMEQFKKETGETITAPFRKFPTFSSFPANPTFRTCSKSSSASRPSNTEENTIKNERQQPLIFFQKTILQYRWASLQYIRPNLCYHRKKGGNQHDRHQHIRAFRAPSHELLRHFAKTVFLRLRRPRALHPL